MASRANGHEIVEAAGGIPRRRRCGIVEVLIIHRPKYDDWSFPKGKREPGETSEECALREVHEETGLLCTLGRELLPTSYVDRRGRPKIVRYWVMQVESGMFAANREVDEIRWVTPERAAARLSYPHDVDVLRSLESPDRCR